MTSVESHEQAKARLHVQLDRLQIYLIVITVISMICYWVSVFCWIIHEPIYTMYIGNTTHEVEENHVSFFSGICNALVLYYTVTQIKDLRTLKQNNYRLVTKTSKSDMIVIGCIILMLLVIKLYVVRLSDIPFYLHPKMKQPAIAPMFAVSYLQIDRFLTFLWLIILIWRYMGILLLYILSEPNDPEPANAVAVMVAETV